MSGWTVVWTLLVTVAVGAVFWRYAPKENQTVWRSTVSLSLAMMFLMWAITYLCQLHPLVEPRRSDLRPENDNSEPPTSLVALGKRVFTIPSSNSTKYQIAETTTGLIFSITRTHYSIEQGNMRQKQE